MSDVNWPASAGCLHAVEEASGFAELFAAPLGDIPTIECLIGRAYEYFTALAAHSPSMPPRFCGCGRARTACRACGGTWLSAAYSAAELPEKADRSEFLTTLIDAGHRDATGIVKAVILGSTIKVVGDVLRAWHRRSVPERSGGRGRVLAVGRNPYLRPAPELCADHIGECAVLVLSSGFPIAHKRPELWPASTVWLQWAGDYQGRDHYPLSDWLEAQRAAELPGHETACEAQWLMCQGLRRGVESGGRVDAHWLCDIALPAGVDALPILLGGELGNFGTIGLDAEADCDEFARSVVARLGVMTLSSSLDMVEEAVSGERNVLDTVCEAGARAMIAWAIERARDPWTEAETDVWGVWGVYVWLGQRHRFIVRALPEAWQAAVTATWDEANAMGALREAQTRHLATVAADPALRVPCGCCDHMALAREMTAWRAAASGHIDPHDEGHIAFVKLLDACGIDACENWHRSVLNLCPALRARHRVLVRSLVDDDRVFTSGVQRYARYLRGAECQLLPIRPQAIADEISAELCSRYHGWLRRRTLLRSLVCGPTGRGTSAARLAGDRCLDRHSLTTASGVLPDDPDVTVATIQKFPVQFTGL